MKRKEGLRGEVLAVVAIVAIMVALGLAFDYLARPDGTPPVGPGGLHLLGKDFVPMAAP